MDDFIKRLSESGERSSELEDRSEDNTQTKPWKDTTIIQKRGKDAERPE